MSAAVVPTQDGDPAHLCLNEARCVDKVDGHARETEKPNTFCRACLGRSATHVKQIPEQWHGLRKMIGDRHAGIDVNIRRPKPSGTVLLNVHVDTLLGAMLEAVTTAAEVLADVMKMNDPKYPKEDPDKPVLKPPWAVTPTLDATERVVKCCRIIEPNLTKLAAIRGVGGREDTDPAIDVMFWVRSGAAHGVKCTTGVQMIQRIDHLHSLAYFTLGQSRARTRRDMPCTRCRAKTVGRWAGSEWWDCSSCGSQFPEDELRRQDKILIELHKRGLLQPEEAS
jgi:hypothetical protein